MTQNQLKSQLHYNQSTGIFTHLHDRGNNKLKGITAGCKRPDGYTKINLNKIPYMAHRLAWLYVYGYMPTEIDHINGKRDDTRISNLREVTRQENMKNRRLSTRNKSGHQGVYYDKSRDKWAVQIAVDGKAKTIGRYKNKNDAIIARKEANVLYGYHINHGELNE